MKLCEWQFSPQHLTYECVEIITKNLGYNQQNTWPQTETLFNIQIESTKILKIIDTIILILCSLICMFCVIRVLVLSKKRTRQVTQIQLSVSVVSSSSNQAFPNRNFASSTNVNIVKANRHIRQLIAICFIFLVANFLDVCLNLLNLDRKSVNLAHYIWTNLIYSFMLPFLFTFYSKHRLLQNGFMRLSKSGLGTEVKRKASFAGSNTSNGTINWGGGAIKKYKSPFSNIMSSRSPSPSGQKHE
uniref:Uncharacterized protein n=1 Tax=Romanomermis culicivorax TaxID=13658 RepID=A0A915JGU8_ROMCU